MPKAERGSVKDIGNRIKAKGLQKLKFYCQMCEKQCRDANGFKCHLTSENHLRQMKIFSDNAGGILDSYSKDFERMYVSTLKMRHGTKLVNANNVYQEVISDKQHIHMNATHWTTLSEFVQYLGKTGKCHVEETERGWYISYIERDASILARQEALKRREEGEKAAEEAQAQRIAIQRLEAIKALDRAGGTVHTEATKMDRASVGEQPIKVALGPGTSSSSSVAATKKRGGVAALPSTSVFGEDDEDDEGEEEQAPKAPKFIAPVATPQTKRFAAAQQQQTLKRNAIQPTGVETEKPFKKRMTSRNHNDGDDDRKDGAWLYRNIIVRIISKKFANGKYYKRKAVVDKILDKKGYSAEVEVLDSSKGANDGGDILRFDQDDLETVIPKRGGSKEKVRLLQNGHKYFGEKAIVEYLDTKRQEGDLRLCYNDKLLKHIRYEDFSKIA